MSEPISSSCLATANPDLALRRARSAIYIDGLWEIVFGLNWLFLALLWKFGYLRLSSFGVGAIAFVILLGFASRYIVHWMKERWVYPRTGFVALRPQPLTRHILFFAVAMLVVVVASMALLVSSFERGFLPLLWFPIIILLMQLWVVLLPITFYHHDWRLYGLVLLSSVISVTVYFWAQRIWGMPGMAWGFAIALSAGLIVSGTTKLLLYIRRYLGRTGADHGE